jgi:hypothetical protein
MNSLFYCDEISFGCHLHIAHRHHFRHQIDLAITLLLPSFVPELLAMGKSSTQHYQVPKIWADVVFASSLKTEAVTTSYVVSRMAALH